MLIKTVTIPPFDVAKFLRHIVKQRNGCWSYNMARDKHGYSNCTINRDKYRAHRVCFTLFNGQIKRGKVLDHICRNTYCINPDHLREVSPRTNVLENSEGVAAINLAKTHCYKGHELSGENLRVSNGKRVCRKCRRVDAFKRYHKNKFKEG